MPTHDHALIVRSGRPPFCVRCEVNNAGSADRTFTFEVLSQQGRGSITVDFAQLSELHVLVARTVNEFEPF